MKYPDRYIITGKVAEGENKGKTVYLYWSDEGGGWWQWSDSVNWAYRFEEPSGSRFEDALLCAGDKNWTKHSCGPWYFFADPKSVEVIAVPAKVHVY
jgi:hypothetical protein